MRRSGASFLAALWLGLSAAQAQEASAGIEVALCRLIDGAAASHGVPSGFFTRLIFQESSFRPGVTSPAGAQGIAQFMPGTARERGLADPFDPEQALPESARLLADLKARFGSWGLAAAAYNGGPARVSSWLAGRGGLPTETENYVLSITGSTAEDWAADRQSRLDGREVAERAATREPARPCGETLVAIRAGRPAARLIEAAFAPWGVQLAGNFSKSRALASFQRAVGRLGSVVGDAQPMVIGTRLRSRGTRAFYRVRLPAQSRAEAANLCSRIQRAGGSCAVLKS